MVMGYIIVMLPAVGQGPFDLRLLHGVKNYTPFNEVVFVPLQGGFEWGMINVI